MKARAALVLLSIALASCGPAQTSQSVTATILVPSPSPTASAVPTATNTPLPTATAAPTLPPDPNNYQCDKSVQPQDCTLDVLRQGSEIGRRYLIQNFGSDITRGITYILKNNPSSANAAEGGGLQTGENPYISVNIANPNWKDFAGPDNEWRRLRGAIHEQTHWWQYLHGCLAPASADPVTDFMVEGAAEYVALMAINRASDLAPGNAIIAWRHDSYDETAWFSDSVVGPLAVQKLLNQSGTAAYAAWCDLVGKGRNPEAAFQAIFGTAIKDFRESFMQQLLGNQRSCTQATCGSDLAGKDPRYGSLTPMIDYTLKAPNLTIRITDQQGKPVQNVNLQLVRYIYNDWGIGTDGEDVTTDANGTLSAPVVPGVYAMHFCDPGWPTHGGGYSNNPFRCVYELNPFEVKPRETKTVDFQYWDIRDTSLPAPNLALTLLGVEGNPLPNQYVQICGQNDVSTVCLNGKTDESGVFHASLKPGSYMARLVQPGQGDYDPRGLTDPIHGMNLSLGTIEYVVPGISVQGPGVTSFTYRFPAPNLQIKFLDANGSPTPNQFFYLCRAGAATYARDQALEKELVAIFMSRVYRNWDGKQIKFSDLEGSCFLKDQTGKTGIFQLHVSPGTYFVYFDDPGSYAYEDYFAHELSGIVVTADQLTVASYQFK